MPSRNNHPGNNLPANKKLDSLETEKEYSASEYMNTNQGVRISDDRNSLKACELGSTLLEDFIFREKMTHFHHERIPTCRRATSFLGKRTDVEKSVVGCEQPRN